MRITIRKKLMFSIGLMALVALMLAGLQIFLSYFEKELMTRIRDVDVKFAEDAQQIRYLDEVLTMSCRTYIFTGGEYWEKRYTENGKILDDTIKESKALAVVAGDPLVVELLTAQDEANLKLVDMELRMFGLVKEGRRAEAIKIIDGDEYDLWKKKYSDIVNRFHRYAQKKLVEEMQYDIDVARTVGNIMMIIAVCAALLAILMGFYLAGSVVRPIRVLVEASTLLGKGDFSQRSRIRTDDEFGELGRAFDRMAEDIQMINTELMEKQSATMAANEELRAANEEVAEMNEEVAEMNEELKASNDELLEAKEELEKKVAEIEKFNSVMIGREQRVLELKKQVAELEEKLKVR